MLQEHQFEEISFDRVSVDSTLEDEARQRRVVKLEARSTSFPRWVSGNRTRFARPGDEITLKASLKRFRGDTATSRMTLRVPRNARGEGSLQAIGGSSYWDRVGVASSFEELLQRLEDQLKNDQLIANLFLRRTRDERSHSRGRPTVQVVKQHDEVLTGWKYFEVRIRRRD